MAGCCRGQVIDRGAAHPTAAGDATPRGTDSPPRRCTVARLCIVAEPASDHVAHEPESHDGTRSELVAATATTLMKSLQNARTALDAELVMCEVFGVLELEAERGSEGHAEAVGALLSATVDYAEHRATGEALTLLHVLASLGPAESRAAAAAALGIPEPGSVPSPWSSRVGRPTFIRGWEYGDVFGRQSSMGLLFEERGRSHALMLLIDHSLGGGIKDAWVATGKEAVAMRDRLAHQMTDNPLATFADLDLESAAVLLCETLAEEPCPVEVDQVEDVARNLHLAASRARLLAGLAGLDSAPEAMSISRATTSPHSND
jgi:hypothetical protein